MTDEHQLIDDILDLKAKLAGRLLELAMARGDRIAAQGHLQAMNKAINARKQLRIAAETEHGGCSFVAAGDADRSMRKELVNG